MKKLLTLTAVLTLAMVLNNVSFAQDAAVEQENAAPMSIENVNEGQVVYENGQNAGDCNSCGDDVSYGCGKSMNYGCGPCGPRRACTPCYANPCNPCPPRGFCGFGGGCAPAANCGPCGGFDGCNSGYNVGCNTGYSACGPYGYGYHRTPVRNLLVRLFAPRPYCGYDAYYGPQGDCNSGCYAPCNGSFSSGCSSCY